jgi:hypothetical protein
MAPLFPRLGPDESGSPTSQVLLRCYDFPSRLSGHLFVSLPGSTRSSSVRVSRLALPNGWRRLPGQGHCSTGDPNEPVYLHVDVSGTSQVPRRSIPCLCPALRPRPNRRSLASLTVSSMLPPRYLQRRLQRFVISGLYNAALAPAAYASRMVLPLSMQSSLPAGWLAFTGRASNPLDRYKRFQLTLSSSFSGFILALR